MTHPSRANAFSSHFQWRRRDRPAYFEQCRRRLPRPDFMPFHKLTFVSQGFLISFDPIQIWMRTASKTSAEMEHNGEEEGKNKKTQKTLCMRVFLSWIFDFIFPLSLSPQMLRLRLETKSFIVLTRARFKNYSRRPMPTTSLPPNKPNATIHSTHSLNVQTTQRSDHWMSGRSYSRAFIINYVSYLTLWLYVFWHGSHLDKNSYMYFFFLF